MAKKKLSYQIIARTNRNVLYNTEEKKVIRRLTIYYKKALREIKQEMLAVQGDILNNSSYNQVYKLQVANNTYNRIESILEGLANLEINLATEICAGAYLSNNVRLDKAINSMLKKVAPTITDPSIIKILEGTKNLNNLNLNVPNLKAVEEIIKTNWSGIPFSDRIWKDKSNLGFRIKETLVSGVIKGQPYKTMAKELSKHMGTSYSNAKRLVKTELNTALLRSDIDTYNNHGITEVEISISPKTTLLTRTGQSSVCKLCRPKDGTIVKLSKGIIGKDLPPFHPNCQCFLLPVVSLEVPDETELTDDWNEIEK